MFHLHGHGRPAPDRAASKRSLRIAAALIGVFMVVEVIGGLITGSLALLADAGHMLSDFGSLALALGAIWLAERPPTPRRSFGYQRAEIVAALLNGLALIAVAVWVLIEAASRLSDPPEVLGGPMLAVACAGLAVNVAAAWILSRDESESLNVSAALRHVVADLLGSIGVITAALVIILTGWREADPIVGGLVGLLVLASAWPILRDSLRILLEQAPPGIDAVEVGRALAAAPGVVEVHDLHIWTITSGFPALSVHVLVGTEEDCHARRDQLERMLHERFELDHTTIQVDHARPELLQLEGVD